MNRKAIILTALSVIIALPLSAQSELKGYVKDKNNGDPLEGAAVLYAGSYEGTVTTADGYFSIPLREGDIVLECSYMGYLPARITLNVKGGNISAFSTFDAKVNDIDGMLHISLTEDLSILSEAGITARKNMESLQTLTNERMHSSFAIENLGASEMSLKGLSDAQESVTKISGISIASAGQLIVRGLGDRYSTTTLNGLPIASPNPDNKLIPLDIFPSSTIRNITVSKVYEASSYADYSGAHIDIGTKSSTEDAFNISVSTGGHFNTIFSESWNMASPSMLSSYRLDRMAEKLPYSEFQDYSATKDIFPKTPFTVCKRTAMPDLNISAGYAKTIDIRGQKMSITASVGSKYSEQIIRNAFQDTYEASGTRKSNFTYDNYSRKENIAALLNIDQTLKTDDAIALTVFFARNASRSFSSRNGVDYEDRILFGESQTDHIYMMTDAQLTGHHRFGKWTVDWGASACVTSSSEPDRRQMLFQFGDDGLLRFFTNNLETYRYFGTLSEKEYSADIKAKYSIDETSSLRFGLSTKDKVRDFSTTRFLYDVSGLTNVFRREMAMDIEPLIGYDARKNGNVTMQRKQNRRDSYDAYNLIGAVFAEYDKHFGQKWDLNIGVRFEAGECRVNYNDDVEDTSRSLPFYDPFFAFNLKYNIVGGHFLRLSASRTVTRPSFVEMAPFLYQESYGGTMLRGNASLKNAYNYNLDLRYEFFTDSAKDMFSITGYFKWLQNPIERIQRYSGGAPEHSFQNADKGMAAGVEAELRKELAKDLCLNVNASYMYTDVILPEGGVYTNPERGLQGASPYLVNADITYSPQFRKGSLSLALLYNLQGPRIHSVGLSGLGDVMQMPFHSMDFNAGWTFVSNISVSVGLSNILNSGMRLRQDIPQTGQRVEVEGWKEGIGCIIGLSWKL
ncbi:MAG: TonB-dependent receptor domain-containing protein [Candidatus Cryptobacteroides sp.]